MTVHDRLRAVRERWKPILVSVVLGAGCAFVLATLSPREYAASATVYVAAGSASADPVAEHRVASYPHLVSTETIGRQVADALGLNADPRAVAGQLTATSPPGTALIDVTATDRSPYRAEQLGNAAAQALARLIAELENPVPGSGSPVTARVVDAAGLPSGPVGPRPVVNAGIGMLVGLLLGGGGTLLLGRLSTKVRSVEQLNRITGAPNLGVVPHDPAAPRQPLIVHEGADVLRAGAFRRIRGNLRYVGIDRPHKMLTVAGAASGHGTTTTLCNLAIAAAQAGTRVAIVDGDLRRPRVADYLGLEGAVGVTTVLAGRAGLDDALQPWGSWPLDVLPSGAIPPNPSELLASRQMRNLLGTLRGRYDLVLLDAPPVHPGTDAAVLGARSDGALLVVRQGTTVRGRLTSALDALDGVAVPVLGTVVTMAAQAKAAESCHHQGHLPGVAVSEPVDSHPTQPMPAVADGDPDANGHGVSRDEATAWLSVTDCLNGSRSVR